MKPRFRSGHFLVLVAALTGGCLTHQEREERVRVNLDAGTVRVTSTYHNLQSASTDSAGPDSEDVGVDFRELIEAWRGDGALLAALDDGEYVLSRRLWLQDSNLDYEITSLSRFGRFFVADPKPEKLYDEHHWGANLLGYWMVADTANVDFYANGTMSAHEDGSLCSSDGRSAHRSLSSGSRTETLKGV